MKIIINRGFNNILSRVLVFRNGQKINGWTRKDCFCEFDAKEEDQILVKIKNLDTTTATVASFIFHEGKDTFYISPNKMLNVWEFVSYKVFLCVCLIYIIYKVAMIESNVFDWVFAAMIFIMALSLVCLQLCMLSSKMLGRFYKLECL